MTSEVVIPVELLPRDGRFGCGPSKVRPDAVADLAEVSSHFLGTSHRQATVRDVVGLVQIGRAHV